MLDIPGGFAGAHLATVNGPTDHHACGSSCESIKDTSAIHRASPLVYVTSFREAIAHPLPVACALSRSNSIMDVSGSLGD